MKRTIWLAGCLAMAAASGVDARTPEQRPPPPRLEQLAQTLGLDAEQSARFVAIMQEQRAKRMALELEAETDRIALRAELEALHAQTLARLTEVLNAEQLEAFERLRPPHPSGPGHHAPAPR